MPRPRLEKSFNLIAIAILGLSIVLGGVWLLFPERLSPEPLLGFLGLLYTAVPLFGRWLVRRLSADVETERTSLPYALAYGYLHNFLAPVVRKLWTEADDHSSLRFYVFIPDSLAELSRDRIQDRLNAMDRSRYAIETVELAFDEKRSRDVRSARHLTGGTEDSIRRYFDFPTTLLTARPAITHKLRTMDRPATDADEEKLGAEYIRDFHCFLLRMLQHDDFAPFRETICVLKGRLDFPDECPEPDDSCQ